MYNQRHYKLLHSVLFLVGDDGAHVCAAVYLVWLELGVGVELVCPDRPVVEQEQHAIHGDSQDKSTAAEEVLFVKELHAESLADSNADRCDQHRVDSEVGWTTTKERKLIRLLLLGLHVQLSCLLICN